MAGCKEDVMRQRSTSGFSVIEIILGIAIIAVIISVGWYAWQNRQETRKFNSNTTQNDHPTEVPLPSNFKKYEDDYISFAHPDNWKIEQQYTFSDTYGAHLIKITGPIDTSVQASDGSKNLFFSGSILIAKNTRFPTVCTHCTVLGVDKISPKDPASDGAIVIAAMSEQGNEPRLIEYTREMLPVGSSNQEELGFVIGQSYVGMLSASYMSGSTSFTPLKDSAEFQRSQAYQQLLQLIPTIQVKTQELPQ